MYADGTPLTVRVTRPPEPPAWPSGTRAAVAVGVSPAPGGGLLQVVCWEDGGYAVVHPAVAWPTRTDPYEGLDDQHRRRWLRFDADEARLDRRNEEFATLPASLVEPGDHIQLHVHDKPQVLEVDRLQDGDGDVPGQEIVFKGRHRPLRGATQGLLIPVRIPRLHPTLAAAIAAITGPPTAGTAAPAPPPHKHLPRHDRVADPHRYTQMIRGQRARLERAVSSGDRNQVVAACRDAVISWNQPGNIWPHDYDQWQAALDQFLPDFGDVDFAVDPRLILEDLTVEPVPDEADSGDEPPALFDVDDLEAGRWRSRPPGPGRRLAWPGARRTGYDRAGPGRGTRIGRTGSGCRTRHYAGCRPARPGRWRDHRRTQRPGRRGGPAGTVPITNSDVATAWQHMTASSSGHAWSVAEFIAHGTVPVPGAVHGPDDPQDITAWDSDGLRRTVASDQPARNGTLTWDQAARWIDAGMTSGDLQILQEAGRVVRFCDGWLGQARDTGDQEQAFYDAGHGATVIVQESIRRVTAAAAQAHGPDAPVPAAPASTGSYRHEQVTTTEQDQDLAAISELGDFAHQAARRVTGSYQAPAGTPATTPSSGPGASPAGPAVPAEPEPAPLCLYGSPARGLAARQAEREASHARQGTGPAASPVHAWRVHPSCPDTPTDQCQTTILSADLRRFGKTPVPPCGHDEPLLYRACCRRPGCDWEGPERDNENTAAEDGCDHAWPGWRDRPAAPEPPRITSGTTKAERTAITRWTEQVNRLYPPGWVEDGGPIRTRREASSGTRHVPPEPHTAATNSPS